jgi:hypothetical protein
MLEKKRRPQAVVQPAPAEAPRPAGLLRRPTQAPPIRPVAVGTVARVMVQRDPNPDYPVPNQPIAGTQSYVQQQLPQSSAVSGTGGQGLANVPSKPLNPLDDKFSSQVESQAGFSWGGLISSMGKLKKAGMAYNEIGSLLAEKGAGGLWQSDSDKQLLVASKNVLTVGEALINTADAITRITNNAELKEQVEKGDKALQVLQAIQGAATVISAFEDNADATANLKAHPNDPKAAEAWGLAVGKSFSALGAGLAPVLSMLPGPWGDYIKGLLGVPSAVISAFITIMHNRYDAIDKEAGLKGDMRYGSFSGPMVPIVAHGFFIQPMQPMTLDNYIMSHKTDLGVDMEKAAQSVSLALIISKLQTELSADDGKGGTVDRTPWLTWLQSQQSS